MQNQAVRTRTGQKGKAVIGAGRKAVIQAIRGAREKAGLTQTQAAELREGRATSTISHWESGQMPRSWDELAEYARALNQPIILRFGPDATKEPPEPIWVERLLTGVMAIETKEQITSEELAQAQAEAAIYLAANSGKPPQPTGGGGGSASNA